MADAVLATLISERRPVVTAYDLFLRLHSLFTPENRKKLYLRGKTADAETLRNVVFTLIKTAGLEVDRDYHRGVYRVLPVGESSADEVTALVNPFCHISHLSAMQRWGLTERRPDSLHLTMPPTSAASALTAARMEADYQASDAGTSPSTPPVKMRFIRHPDMVRGRKILVHTSRRPTQWMRLQDSFVRLATVGQTFLDTVEHPEDCGGMPHVIEVWKEHAPIFLQEIISAMDEFGTPIAKVRAGYLLDELLGIGADARVDAWQRFAQRGGSRVLDPTKAFNPIHSEKWMLSINV